MITDICKTQKALKSLAESTKLLREAGFQDCANTLDSMYAGIDSDLSDGLAMAKDIREEQRYDE